MNVARGVELQRTTEVTVGIRVAPSAKEDRVRDLDWISAGWIFHLRCVCHQLSVQVHPVRHQCTRLESFSQGANRKPSYAMCEVTCRCGSSLSKLPEGEIPLSVKLCVTGYEGTIVGRRPHLSPLPPSGGVDSTTMCHIPSNTSGWSSGSLGSPFSSSALSCVPIRPSESIQKADGSPVALSPIPRLSLESFEREGARGGEPSPYYSEEGCMGSGGR